MYDDFYIICLHICIVAKKTRIMKKGGSILVTGKGGINERIGTVRNKSTIVMVIVLCLCTSF